MLSPDIKPIIVNTSAGPGDKSRTAATASVRKASEKALVMRAVDAMAATGVRFERSKVEFENPGARGAYAGWVMRMDPPLDALGLFETMGGKKDDRVRFAVRQVLEMEWKKESARREEEARRRRGGDVPGDNDGAEESKLEGDEEANKVKEKDKGLKRDFFGRIVSTVRPGSAAGSSGGDGRKKRDELTQASVAEGRVWVSFHEGFSNAVRKPVTIEELVRGL